MKEPITWNILKDGMICGKAPLDEECINCHGKKKYTKADREAGVKSSGFLASGICGRCEGVGLEPTELGRTILKLIDRYAGTSHLTQVSRTY